jgi:Magnesium chelatase, subunit ChlI C-terminal/Magnesium chelatase, subunit ChlI
MIQRYVAKISGPLLDRIDIHIEVPDFQYRELRCGAAAEGSAEIRARVMAASERQRQRFSKFGDHVYSNAQMTTRQIRVHCELGADARTPPAAAGFLALWNAIKPSSCDQGSYIEWLRPNGRRPDAQLPQGSDSSSHFKDAVMSTGVALLTQLTELIPVCRGSRSIFDRRAPASSTSVICFESSTYMIYLAVRNRCF